MVIGFKPQFVEPILNGTKIHTIREDEHDRWQPEIKIHMATGVRTKNYRCFKEDECVSVQWLYMSYIRGQFEVSVMDDPMESGRYMYPGDISKLARNDGFETLAAFKNWFVSDMKRHKKDSITRKLIHWTKFRY